MFWEQGTGKTRLVCDTITHLATQGKIDAVLVLAPNGVHQTWIDDEIPMWIGSHKAMFTGFWTSSKSGTLAHKKMVERAFEARFSIMAMGYEGFMTKAGKKFAQKLLKDRKVLMVCDESTAIKTPNAQRTKSIVAAGKHAAFRRILTGTPITNNPFDIYTQMRFLDSDFWKKSGFSSFTAFKTYFGVWEEGYNKEQSRQYQYVVAFRNLSDLKELLAPVSSRVLKKDTLDLPPKLYSKRYFTMSPEQKRIYRELADHAMALLSSGELITTPLVITQLLRLHQVTCNYLPAEDPDDPPRILDPNSNPRLDLLREVVGELGDQQAIIWARFDMDVDLIMQLLGPKAVQADGRVKADQRTKNLNAFKQNKVQFLVSKPQTKGVSRGQTLLCPAVIYFNNTFSLEDRLQSEDRPHRAGQTQAVNYIDIVAPGTVDVKIVAALRQKQNIASEITGDELKEWL